MLNQNATRFFIFGSTIACLLSACSTNPPYHDFKKPGIQYQHTAVGAGVGALTGTALGTPLVGMAVGATTGTLLTIQNNTLSSIIKSLEKNDIQFVEYNGQMTLIVPTDVYFEYHSAELNERAYPGLNQIIALLAYYPKSRIVVAGFTDNSNNRHQQMKLAEAQSEAMLTFLWANHIPAKQLHAKGYGANYPIGDNKLIHASAYNRRIEIQWHPADTAIKQAQHPMK